MHDTLWAPWRMQYLRNLENDSDESTAALTDFITEAWAYPDQDQANLVIHRTSDGLIMLNRYPYSAGHLLVALGDARGRLMEYDPTQRQAFWSLVDKATEMVHQTLHPQGVNLGVNEGAAAGAGLPGHLHAHVVPRWFGDVNFMSTTAASRVIPSTLEAMAEMYRGGESASIKDAH